MDKWPSLPLEDWSETFATLHMWLQIVGKMRLVRSPWINHAWQTAFYVTARGLTTSPIPQGAGTFEAEFDFVDHRLVVRSSSGGSFALALAPQSVAAFYTRVMAEMEKLGHPVKIYPRPNEVENPIPFERDEVHRAYDPEYANRYFRVLAQSNHVFTDFRARFIGKCSPVHYFWGAPDLAVTRFSGRPAPEHPGGIPHLPDRVTREAYSHEVSSAGFWSGGGPVPYAAFYSYAYPEPPGFASASVAPEGAFYSTDLHEFLLPYDRVRRSATPEATLMEFLQSTYEAAADLGGWDRRALERRRDGEPAGNATGNSR